MSEWYEVKNADDIDFSDDKKFVHILFDANRNGNRYVEVPVDMLVKILAARPENYRTAIIPCPHCGVNVTIDSCIFSPNSLREQ